MKGAMFYQLIMQSYKDYNERSCKLTFLIYLN